MTVKVLAVATILGLSCFGPLSSDFVKSGEQRLSLYPNLSFSTRSPVPSSGDWVAFNSVFSSPGILGAFRLCRKQPHPHLRCCSYENSSQLLHFYSCFKSPCLFLALSYGLYVSFNSIRVHINEGGSSELMQVCLKKATFLEISCKINQ